MEIKKQGGKRRGAGRKPVLSKKKQVSLYVEGAKMLRFGGEEKMKTTIYSFIDNFGSEEVRTEIKYTPISAAAYDGKKSDKIALDEPSQWEEPKSSITGLSPKLSVFDNFTAELKVAKTIKQVENIMKRAKGEVMFPREKVILENYAKELSKEMYTD